MFDLIREIGQTLSNNKLRTILTGGAVAWGIFMLIVLLGAARGVNNAGRENLRGQSFNVISIWPGWTSKAYGGFKEGRQVKLKDKDGTTLKQKVHGVSKAEPFASVDTAKLITARDAVSGGFGAIFPGVEASERAELLTGRFINQRDMADARRVMVLHERVARQLFGTTDEALGATVQCMGLAWTVVGIYSHRWRTQTFVPYATFKELTGNTNNVNQYDVTVEGLVTESDGDAAEQAIRNELARAHNFDPEDKSALWSWNQFNSYLRGNMAESILNWTVWIIGIFMLISGIVGVSNIMFVSVRERTHEIGIRRAIGAKPRNILTQILAEAVAITTIFGYIGVVLGMLVLQVINSLFGNMEMFKNPTVDISIALQVTIVLIIAGAFAGLFPALKAIKVKPVEALRDE